MARAASAMEPDTVRDQIAAARSLYEAGRYADAAVAVRSFLSTPPACRSDHATRDALVLGVWASAEAGDFEAGSEFVRCFGRHADGLLDFCYAACLLEYRSSRLDDARAWGERYLERRKSSPEGAEHAATFDKQHEILNLLGCLAKRRGDVGTAARYLNEAISAAPAYACSYLNLAQLAWRGGRLDEARRVLRRGLAACGSDQQLLGLLSDLPSPQTISLCMIVRNEEQMLPRALESVRGVVDEIVVVDTGSDDRTVEIARSFGARVFHHAWEDDFSKARNQSLAHASGDWLLVLDADECLDAETAPVVRFIAATCRQDAVALSVYNIDSDHGGASFQPSIRMFRNRRGFSYAGIVHNQLVLPPECPVMRAPVRIDHYGYTPSVLRARRKVERTAALLSRQLALDPDDAFAHFNMAQALRGDDNAARHARDIKRHARRVVELISPGQTAHRHVLVMAHHQLATAHLLSNQYRAAAAACRRALALCPDFLDALFTLGQSLLRLGKPGEARAAFLRYLAARRAYRPSEETAGYILLHLDLQHEVYQALRSIRQAGKVRAVVRQRRSRGSVGRLDDNRVAGRARAGAMGSVPGAEYRHGSIQQPALPGH